MPFGIIGIPNKVPKTPGLVIEKVDSWISSGDKFPERALSAKSAIFFDISVTLSESASLTTGTMSPGSKSTAIPIFTLLRSMISSPDKTALMFLNLAKRREQAQVTKAV